MIPHPVLLLAQWFALVIATGVTLTALYDGVARWCCGPRNRADARQSQLDARLIYSRHHHYRRSRL